MNIDEIVRNLKYEQKKHENDRVDTFQTNISVMCKDCADCIEELKSRAEKAEIELKNARNELCLKCGKYHEAYDGACDGCKWKEQNDE